MKKQAEEFVMNLTDDIEKLALEEFDKNFDREGFFDRKWEPSARAEDDPDALTLTDTATMRNDITGRVEGPGEILIYNFGAAPYIHMHNNGFKGRVNVPAHRVRAHKRKNKWGRTEKVKAHTRKAHTKTITMPQRQIIGQHPELDGKIEKLIETDTLEFLKKGLG